jgi:thiol:disulfide interchange protein
VDRLANDYYQDYLDTFRYNVDNPGNADMVSRYRVSGLPTTVILDSSGQVANRLVGFTNEGRMRSAIENVLYR